MIHAIPAAPRPVHRLRSIPATKIILASIAPPKPQRPKPKTVLLHLARYGDIINILPIARHIKQIEGKKPGIIVQSKFSDILEGVSYATYEPAAKEWDSPNEIRQAAQSITGQYERTMVCQLFDGPHKCDAFNVETWLRVGYLPLWNKLPLVFDRRNVKRERRLCEQYLDSSRPNILVNTIGTSSPYPHAGELWETLRKKLGKFNLVDMGAIRAERIYDLIGLFDRAHSLVTTDTATLHLAYASKVPMIALITDFPDLWFGARPRGNVKLSIRYQESLHRMEEIAEAATLTTSGSNFKLVHVYSAYDSLSLDTKRRMNVAAQTWSQAYRSGGWEAFPIFDHDLTRRFQDPGRTVPYVRDLIDLAIRGSTTEDIIVLTNADVCLADGAEEAIRDKLRSCDATYSFRTDFERLDHPLSLLETKTLKSEKYSGADLFAFRASWWRAYEWKFPDLLLGTEAWDWCMRTLIDRTTTGTALPDIIYHERHVTTWETNKLTLPSQKHNRALAKTFLTGMGVYNGELE